MAKLVEMNQEQLVIWVQSLSLKFTDKIVDGIRSFEKENGIEYDGSCLSSAGLGDIMEVMNVNNAFAKALLQQVAAKKDEDYGVSAPTDEPEVPLSQEITTFTLKIEAKLTHNIKNVNKNWTIGKCKFEFLRSLGQDGKAALYADHANEKWVSPNKKEGIEFKYLGKNLSDGVTLASINITNGTAMPLVTTFRVNGGAELKENEQDEYDKIRPRKINRKLLKEAGLSLSRKPCCIMGYSDMDGISRAQMPCGCSFAADTMFRYMKSLFDKNLKAVKPICPVSKGKGKFECKGNDKQRSWDWGSVFVVADLSDREISRFTKAIENRLGSTKNCPNCGAVTEKNEDVRISRVNCSACSGRDWCWNCGKPWNHSGLGPICGNKGCMADRLSILLLPENCGTFKVPSPGDSWNTENEGEDIVKTRACPKCLCLLEYVAACKHMKCIACPHQFCFNCTGTWKGGPWTDGECGYGKCCKKVGPQRFV